VVHHDDFTPTPSAGRTRRYVGPPEDSRDRFVAHREIPLNHTEKISLGQPPARGSANIPQRQVAEIRGKNATKRQAVRRAKPSPLLAR